MNKSESKYFHTAIRMDEAFLGLLEKKDFSYITVKEICEAAGVNRSTFYLHYETIGDLLSESIEYMQKNFLSYFKPESEGLVVELRECEMQKLYLITPEYLQPYLSYIRDNKRLFKTSVEHAQVLRMTDAYEGMYQYVLTPILERFEVPKEDRGYLTNFYIHGLMAIIEEWLKEDCQDSMEHVIAIMEQCVMGEIKKR